MSIFNPQLEQQLLDLIDERLGNWPPQWEGFHWPGYTYEHTLRVRNLALALGEAESADPEVVAAAALLHDIRKADGREHATTGAAEAEGFLQGLDVPAEFVERVRYVIATHSGDNTPEHPAENRVLGDADLIDANFGYVATWRFITIRAGRECDLLETVDQMIEWLPKKDELMSLLRSDAGRACAKERSVAMHRWCDDIRAAFANGAGGELRELVEYVAGDYHRASLREQLAVWQPKESGAAAAACQRLGDEVEGLK